MRNRNGFSLLEVSLVMLVMTIILCMALPNVQGMQRGFNQKNALTTLRAINQAEGYYGTIYHNGFVTLQQISAVSSPASCDSPVLLPGQFTMLQAQGYQFTFTLSATLAEKQTGCSAAGAVGYTVTATPIQPGVTGNRYFFADATGIIRSNEGSPADSGSQPVTW